MKTPTALIAGLATMIGTASAAPVSYDFTHTGFSGGGSVTGSFLADDLDGDGQINSFDGEVLDFSMTFSGDSLISDFSLIFGDLFGLVYDLGSGVIGDSTSLAIEGIGASGATVDYSVGPGPLALCDGVQICGVVFAVVNGSSVTSETIFGAVVNDPTAPVPMPGAMALFVGAAAFGGRILKRRKLA